MDVAELLWAGADAQARALADGLVTAEELLDAVLRRIDEVNPRLNLFRAVYTDAAREAAAEAQRRIEAGERTPLLGVPVAVKDDLDVAGDPTGSGGLPQAAAPEHDSAAIARLRTAGAVIVGRTHVPDRCLWPFTETLTHGATRNPWDPDRSPGGSSGGSGAAIAAGIVGVATGSDGGGSVRIPASACRIFGLKTTRGLVPTQPLDDHWHGLAVFGPLGRHVADAAAMLDVVAEPPVDAPAPAGGYRTAVDTDPGPLRIALSWSTPLGRPLMQAARKQAVLDTAARLSALGHHVEVAEPKLGLRPLPQFLVRYLAGVADDVAALAHPEWLEARTRRVAALGRALPGGTLPWAMAAESTVDAIMREFFSDFDVVLQPSQVWPPSRVGRYHGRGALATLLGCSMEIPYFPTWNVLGYPVAAVPVGRDAAGLPMAVQLAGPAWSEHTLLSLAAQYERAHPWADDRPPG